MVARLLVERSLAAGVQIVPIESIYRWEGVIVEDNETLLITKTRAERFEEIEALVGENHSYQVPPVLLVGVDAASEPYLNWIDDVVRADLPEEPE